MNASTALFFLRESKEDINVREAFLHLASDALIALGVSVAGFVILKTGWSWLDPSVSLLVSGVIIWGTWGLLKDSVNLVLDAVPEGIDPVEVRKHLEELEGVVSVHDLHIWGMSTTEAALTVHLVRDKVMVDNAFLVDAAEKLHDEFGIEHATVQVETVKDAPLHQGCEA